MTSLLWGNSWYEPAICAIALALMREFNTLSNHQSTMQPLIYTTFQAYLRRSTIPFSRLQVAYHFLLEHRLI